MNEMGQDLSRYGLRLAFFLDTSRNQSRRRCDMKYCGNRAKANRFYQKRRKT